MTCISAAQEKFITFGKALVIYQVKRFGLCILK